VHLQSVREEERTRIAREVHDELGQALTSCKLDLSWIAGKLPRELRDLQKKAKALSAHIDTTIQTVRRIAEELRPSVLDHLGLAAALEWQGHDFQHRTGIKCDVQTNLADRMLDQALSTALFRIFQETLTNIIRHAGATQVMVQLKETDSRVSLQVRDNGQGITRMEISNAKSLGLLGMRERAALLGGTFKIGRIPRGQGTQVTVIMPVPAPPPPPAPEVDHENSVSRRSRRSPSRIEANPRG
jgi:signal transduction histidine kinase